MSKNNFNKNIIGKLITPVNRRVFKRMAGKYNDDFACKKLNSWEHFVAILLGQFTGCSSLRQIKSTIKYHSSEQYHLGISKGICRATLSDGNNRRG